MILTVICRCVRRRRLAAVLLLAMFCSSITATEPATAVIFPQLKPPYNQVIDSIVEGVSSFQSIEKIPLSENFTPSTLLTNLKIKGITNVVVLGSNGHALAESLGPEFNVVNAAVLASPDTSPANVSTVSMIPNPATLFRTLRNINPVVENVFVVYASDTGQWQVDQAKRETLTLGISLNAVHVKDVKDAGRAYKKILADGLNENDAIWLLHDRSVDDPALLERLLDASWKQNFTLFSSNATHVPRGVLFAIYPDNFQMGVQIAKLLKNAKTHPTRDLKPTLNFEKFDIAVNETTAQHLGLHFSKKQRERFAVTFPAKK